jgi:hypothetical protein
VVGDALFGVLVDEHAGAEATNRPRSRVLGQFLPDLEAWRQPERFLG